jgi:predicted dehydrogenase
MANALLADPAVEIVGMAEIGLDRVTESLDALRADPDLQDPAIQQRIKVGSDAIFVGMDAFKDLMAMDLDYVILTTPPGFRPLHYAEAVRRGLHVFAEKPLATDPAGCRRIRASAEEAKRNGLSTVVGLNYRHDLATMATIDRIHAGALGEITGGNIYRLGGGLWHRGSNPAWSPMEYQCRNWYYHGWLGGDQIVEMLIHQIDLMNWALGATPIRALGQGGRQVRTDPMYGNIFDHMTVDYEYPGGVHVTLMCRQWDGCEGRNENRVIGTQGESDNIGRILGRNRWAYQPSDDLRHNASVYEHMELIESIRRRDARNDMLDFAIDSTLTAIMGRESAYTGQSVTWDEIAASPLDLFPASYAFGPAPEHPVPMPGHPRLVR